MTRNTNHPTTARRVLSAVAASVALLLSLTLAFSAHAAEPGQAKAVNSTVRVKVHGLKQGQAPIMSRILAAGSVAPWRPGAVVEVWFFHNGQRIQVRRLPLEKAAGNFGTFRTQILMREGGKYAVRARYAGYDGPKPVKPGSSAHKSWKVSYRAIRNGECGLIVRGFRDALNRIGVVPAQGSCFNDKMRRAVLAYRKLNRMSRNSIASKSVVQQVFNGRGRYRVRKPGLGRHVEAPLDRQVIVFADGNKPYAIFPVASGAKATPTILGTYSFYRKDPGYNEKEMYYSSYFIRGYAIHGYKSVPNYPASHGCLRTFIADQPRIYNMTEIGMPIYVFGNAFRSLGVGEDWSTAGDLGPDLGPTGGLDPAH